MRGKIKSLRIISTVMSPRFSKSTQILNILLDVLLMIAAVWLTTLISPGLLQGSGESLSVDNILFIYILFPTIWVIVLAQLGAYSSEKNLRVVDEIYNLFIGALLAVLLLSALIYLARIPLSRGTVLLNALLAFSLLLIWRLIYRLLFQSNIRKSASQRRILIVGAGEIGRRFEREIDDFSEVGYALIGFVDDDPQLIERQADVLGTIDQVPDLVKGHNIDNIIIALPHGAYQRINALMRAVHTLPVRVWVIPDYFALMLSKSSVWNFVGIPMMSLYSPILNERQRIIKRGFDLLIALPFFIITLPLFGLIALMIKMDSPGPVLYKSKRLKENGETFTMLKFRTMVEDADEKLSEMLKAGDQAQVVHKKPDDPRVTRVGKVLRRTSLDELPQLINIIKGEMSLVGPRPELPELVQYYQPWQHMRFAVPQGLTGWWQVNGRSDKPMHRHTDEDLYYIQHYSLWLDIQILIKTLLVVLRGKGAY